VSLVVYDSDAGLLGGLLGDEAAPQVVGLGLAPAGVGRTVKDFYVPYYNDDIRSGPEVPPEPEWLELWSPEAAEALEMHNQDPRAHARPTPVGGLLVSFELRPEQEARKAEARRSSAAPQRGMGGLGSLLGAGSGGIALPRLVPCYVEVSLVGVRDMLPRMVAGVPVEIAQPYVEFEYGHRSCTERLWRTRATTAFPSSATSVMGPSANFLETLYLQARTRHGDTTHYCDTCHGDTCLGDTTYDGYTYLRRSSCRHVPCTYTMPPPCTHHAHATRQVELPDDPRYYPVMGIRLRDSARLFSFLPGNQDPICGVCSVPLGELMPSHARHAATLREAEAEAEAERRRRQALLDAVVEEVKLEGPPRPDASNEEVTEIFSFESHARSKRDTKAAQADAHLATRTPTRTRT
jgi:hypothetical protein